MSEAPQQYPTILKDFYHAAYAATVGREDVPPLLYHYTGMEGVQKILEGKTIRFSHIYFMNDFQEVHIGLKIIFNALYDVADSLKEDRDIATLLIYLANTQLLTLGSEAMRDDALTYLAGLKETDPEQYEQFKLFQARDIFISCFSAESDSLPMWYMYADQAKGAALGFDSAKLIGEHNALLASRGGYLMAAKIIYNEDRFKALVANFIQQIVDLALAAKKETGDLKKLKQGEVGNDFFFSATYYLSVLAVSLKHHKFQHENEWRLFTTLKRYKKVENKKFALSNGRLKPYHFITYPTSNAAKLVDFVVGAGNPNMEWVDDKPRLEWIKTYLENIEASCEITPSCIPFRNV